MTPAITPTPLSAPRRTWPGCLRRLPAWVRWSETPPEDSTGLQPQARRRHRPRLELSWIRVTRAQPPARPVADGPRADGPIERG